MLFAISNFGGIWRHKLSHALHPFTVVFLLSCLLLACTTESAPTPILASPTPKHSEPAETEPPAKETVSPPKDWPVALMQSTGFVGDVSLARLPNDQIVLVWLKAGGLSTSIRGRVYTPDWQPASAEFTINTQTLQDRIDADAPYLGGLRYYPYKPQVVAGPNGGFAVMWRRAQSPILRIFDSKGQAVTQEIPTNIQEVYRDATLLAWNGALLLLCNTIPKLQARLLDWQGNTLKQATLPDVPITKVLTDLEGRFAIFSSLPSPTRHQIQWFDQNLQALEEPFELAINGRLEISQIPNTASWLLLWETKATEPDTAAPNSLSIQYYERNRLIGAPKHFSPIPNYARKFLIGTKVDSRGNISLIWEEGETLFTQKGHVSMLRLNSDLQPLEGAFVLDQQPSGLHYHARLEASSPDTLTVVWEHQDRDQGSFSLYGRTLDLKQLKIEPLPQPGLPSVTCNFSSFQGAKPFIAVPLTSSSERIEPGHVVIVLRKPGCLNQLLEKYQDIQAVAGQSIGSYQHIGFNLDLYPIDKTRADLKRLAPNFGLEGWHDNQIKTFAIYQDLIHRFGAWLEQIYLSRLLSPAYSMRP